MARLYNDSLAALSSGEEDLLFTAQGSGAFDSYRLSDEDLTAGAGLTSYRLLTVDNHLFLPTERHVRARVTSADVLHSWAIPALGVKLDACPGRLNQASLFLKREGIYYGGCSEICGVGHGFRPIGIVSVELFAGLTPTALDVEPLLAALQAIALDLFLWELRILFPFNPFILKNKGLFFWLIALERLRSGQTHRAVNSAGLPFVSSNLALSIKNNSRME